MTSKRRSPERRAALRAAYGAIRDSSDRPPEELRRVFEAELARRGVTDLTPAQLDAAVDAAQSSPARVALRLLLAACRLARTVVTAARDGYSPKWTASPSDAECYEWPDESADYFGTVTLAPNTDVLVQRMLSTCGRTVHPDVAKRSEQTRSLELWLDRHEVDRQHGTAPVHVGREIIGSVSGHTDDILRRMFDSISGDRLTVEGYLVGDDANTAHVEIELPASP